MAKGLNNLAAMYKTQGQYTQAEPLYMRSLMIVEKTLGPDHPHVATILGNLASLYRETKRENEEMEISEETQKKGDKITIPTEKELDKIEEDIENQRQDPMVMGEPTTKSNMSQEELNEI